MDFLLNNFDQIPADLQQALCATAAGQHYFWGVG
jgi:hypothetical protein